MYHNRQMKTCHYPSTPTRSESFTILKP